MAIDTERVDFGSVAGSNEIIYRVGRAGLTRAGASVWLMNLTFVARLRGRVLSRLGAEDTPRDLWSLIERMLGGLTADELDAAVFM